MSTEAQRKRYWKANLRLLAKLLSVWFLTSCVLSILVVEPLNRFSFGGAPLGMWFAQQGSILVFIVLIFIYCRRMDRIDREFHVESASNTDVHPQAD